MKFVPLFLWVAESGSAPAFGMSQGGHGAGFAAGEQNPVFLWPWAAAVPWPSCSTQAELGQLQPCLGGLAALELQTLLVQPLLRGRIPGQRGKGGMPRQEES